MKCFLTKTMTFTVVIMIVNVLLLLLLRARIGVSVLLGNLLERAFDQIEIDRQKQIDNSLLDNLALVVFVPRCEGRCVYRFVFFFGVVDYGRAFAEIPHRSVRGQLQIALRSGIHFHYAAYVNAVHSVVIATSDDVAVVRVGVVGLARVVRVRFAFGLLVLWFRVVVVAVAVVQTGVVVVQVVVDNVIGVVTADMSVRYIFALLLAQSAVHYLPLVHLAPKLALLDHVNHLFELLDHCVFLFVVRVITQRHFRVCAAAAATQRGQSH